MWIWVKTEVVPQIMWITNKLVCPNACVWRHTLFNTADCKNWSSKVYIGYDPLLNFQLLKWSGKMTTSWKGRLTCIFRGMDKFIVIVPSISWYIFCQNLTPTALFIQWHIRVMTYDILLSIVLIMNNMHLLHFKFWILKK